MRTTTDVLTSPGAEPQPIEQHGETRGNGGLDAVEHALDNGTASGELVGPI